MLISYIIPVYNGEKYLKKCIDSLLQQNYSDILFEIICIDDCSKDKSKEIIQSYQTTNANIILIENTRNLKTGSVCNIGLDNAKGDYVWIIGQDDWIDEQSIDKLFPFIENKVDLIAFNYKRVSFEETELHSEQVFDNVPTCIGSDFIMAKFGRTFPHYLLGYEWRAIYNKEFLIRNNIRFPDGVIYEDTTFLFKSILFAQTFCSISNYLYNYRVNTNSITDVNKKYSGSLVFEFAFITGNEVYTLARELQSGYYDFAPALYEIAVWYRKSFGYKVVGSSIKEKRVFYSLIKKHSDLVRESVCEMSWFYRCLANPIVGFFMSLVIKPFYAIKQQLKYRNQKQREWCY